LFTFNEEHSQLPLKRTIQQTTFYGLQLPQLFTILLQQLLLFGA
jgi:hypothetical protein